MELGCIHSVCRVYLEDQLQRWFASRHPTLPWRNVVSPPLGGGLGPLPPRPPYCLASAPPAGQELIPPEAGPPPDEILRLLPVVSHVFFCDHLFPVVSHQETLKMFLPFLSFCKAAAQLTVQGSPRLLSS